MLTHYAKSFDELGAVQTRSTNSTLAEYLEPQSSYVSVLELGLYEASGESTPSLRDRGLKPHSPNGSPPSTRSRRARPGAAQRGAALGEGAAAALRLLLPDGQEARRGASTGTSFPTRSARG
jgi:hypothetical protein